MNRSLAVATVAALVLLCFPSVVYGHVGREAGEGFVAGMLHPVSGLDHFLAMLSVGVVSAQLGGRRIFTVPATFVLAMICGAVIGVWGYRWPLSEEGIALSVVVLGIGIATVKANGRSWPVMAVVALFGSLHGHAHGLELPRSADPVYYAAGFVMSTTAIHLLGVGIGHVLTTRPVFVRVLRHMGSGMAGMGLMILLDSMAPK
ncbi:MAG: HupE/UreJ family protein [Acidobacteria bacterium]|nr:HupE/UreJ family protein [Acidobacteriota bacterium]